MFDILIIGGGPAGYTAAIYAARAGLDVAVIERGLAGGQAATTDVIDNFPGIPHVSGAELGERMQKHAESLGAETLYEEIESVIKNSDGTFTLHGIDDAYVAKTVIAAMGAHPRAGDFGGENKFRGRGVSYCATCDGMFYKGKKVFVIGGGNSACEEALFLASLADHVDLIVRRDALRAPKGVQKQLENTSNITVRYQTKIKSISGEALPDTIEFEHTNDGSVYAESYKPGSFGVFVFTGTIANSDLVSQLVDLDQAGAVIAADDMSTRTPGLFCAGDIRQKQLRQAITACSDGAIAAMSAYSYISAL